MAQPAPLTHSGPRFKHSAQDYLCPECGATREDVCAIWSPVPDELRAYKGEEYKEPVYCTACLTANNRYVAMDWAPKRAQNDLTTGGTGLEIDIDGTTHRFDSYREMHQFARESQRRADGGDGTPVNFRALHQNRGNMERHTLSGTPYERDKQIPYADIGRTVQGRKIGRGVLSRKEAERRYGSS